MAKQEKSAAELYREERKERIAKAAKKNAKKSHKIILSKKVKSAIAALIVLAIVAGIGAFAVNNSGILERGKVAFKVGDTEITSAEYSYYYNNIFNNYFNYSYQYDTYYGEGMGVLYTGYDYKVSPDEQAYSGEIEGIEKPTFADFFDNSAKENLKYIKACLAYAEEHNIVLDEEDKKEIEASIAETEASVNENNYSLPAYLRMAYGKGMSVALFEKLTEEQFLLEKVTEVVRAEMEEGYTDKKVEKTFNDQLTTYGYVSLRNYVIKADTVEVKVESTENEGQVDITNEVTDETMAAAKAKAEAFASAVKDEDSFKKTASEYEKAAKSEKYKEMLTDDSLTLIEDTTYSDLSYDVTDEKFLDWAIDEETAVGSTYIVENEDTGYTVYMMADPVHKAPDSKTYDVRHILVKFPEETTEETTEEATEEKAEEKTEEKDEVKVEKLDTAPYKDITVAIDVDLDTTKDKALYAEAQDILKTYLDGDRTEEAFAELAVKHSADSNAADGGIYEGVTEGYMVPEFEGWALAKDRNYGDVGIVETKYGYHVMFFIKTVKTTWSDTIKSDLSAAEFEELSAELAAGDNVKITDIVEEELAAVAEAVVKTAKQQIRNMSQG